MIRHRLYGLHYSHVDIHYVYVDSAVNNVQEVCAEADIIVIANSY